MTFLYDVYMYDVNMGGWRALYKGTDFFGTLVFVNLAE